MTLQIAVRVPPCAPVRQLVDLAQHMERGGIDRVSFPDSQLLWRDVWSTLTATAMATTDLAVRHESHHPTSLCDGRCGADGR
jgi:5,10-methylenetetrahydromethanopterin reductase